MIVIVVGFFGEEFGYYLFEVGVFGDVVVVILVG